MKRYCISFIIFLFVILYQPCMGLAHITTGPLVGDNMVVQQQSEVRLWGWTDKGAQTTVTLCTSWNQSKQKVKADENGRWEFSVSTPAASFTPQTITLSDGDETRVLENVLIGEVWLASGQSNMEMPLHGFEGCPVENSAQHIAESTL